MNLIIELDRFSGPMDLLLYLIRKEEMDIFDININQITKQYLNSIKQMKKLDLEVAGDFIAMASTLIQIKAKMLLPQYGDDGEVLEEEDPRKDLVRRLLEYQVYQDAGKKLYDRNLVGRDVLLRGRREEIESPEGELIIEEDNALYALISSYRVVVRKMMKAVHKVAKSLKSIRDRILEIKVHLQVGRRVMMSEMLLVEGEDPRGTKLITFLSLLELAKLGLVSLFQSENYADIHIEAKSEITEDIISKVETYEGMDSDAAATEIWMTAEDFKAEENKQQTEENALVEAATDEEIAAELGEELDARFDVEASEETVEVISEEIPDVISDEDNRHEQKDIEI